MRKTTSYDIGFRGAGGPPPFSTSALQVGVLQRNINEVTTGIICADSMADGWLDTEERCTIIRARLAQNRLANLRLQKARRAKQL